jgi:hypothetical protein
MNKQIKGVKLKRKWAAFDFKGNLIYATISNTKKEAELKTITIIEQENIDWIDCILKGYTTNKILVDIKLL